MHERNGPVCQKYMYSGLQKIMLRPWSSSTAGL